MNSGLCCRCKEILTEENCALGVLKRRNGYCRTCNFLHRLESVGRNPYRFKYGILKHTSKKKGISLELNAEEYSSFVGRPCSYCGSSLLKNPFGYGLDRINYKKGYSVDNCVSCCWACNTLKGRIESLGFSPSRSVELLKEINESKKSETGYGDNSNSGPDAGE